MQDVPVQMRGGHSRLTSFLMRTRKPCMPWSFPSIISCANTADHLACTELLVIQYFCATVVGVLMMNSSVSLSKIAVVSISTALLPAQMQLTHYKACSHSPSRPCWRASIDNTCLASSNPSCCLAQVATPGVTTKLHKHTKPANAAGHQLT